MFLTVDGILNVYVSNLVDDPTNVSVLFHTVITRRRREPPEISSGKTNKLRYYRESQ